MSAMIVEKLKWDGLVTARWPAHLLTSVRGRRIVWVTPSGTVRERPGRSPSEPTTSVERSASAGWWVATLRGDGRGARWKIDIAAPAAVVGERIEFVDLDLDLHIGPGATLRLRDVRQFAARARRDGYPARVILGAVLGLVHVLFLAGLRRWPFDGSLALLPEGEGHPQGPTTRTERGSRRR